MAPREEHLCPVLSAYVHVQCTSFSGNDAQAANDERADDDDSLLFASGPAILTAPAEPKSRRSSHMTLSPNDIDIEVEGTAVEESTVVEGTPVSVRDLRLYFSLSWNGKECIQILNPR